MLNKLSFLPLSTLLMSLLIPTMAMTSSAEALTLETLNLNASIEGEVVSNICPGKVRFCPWK